MDKNMYSEKFLKFIEMWENDFGIKRTIEEKSPKSSICPKKALPLHLKVER